TAFLFFHLAVFETKFYVRSLPIIFSIFYLGAITGFSFQVLARPPLTRRACCGLFTSIRGATVSGLGVFGFKCSLWLNGTKPAVHSIVNDVPIIKEART